MEGIYGGLPASMVTSLSQLERRHVMRCGSRNCMLQKLPPDFRLRMAVHTGANYPETVQRFCDRLGLRVQVNRMHYGSRLPVYGLFKCDHLLYYADRHGDMQTDRPVCRTKDFIFVQGPVPLNAMKNYLAATVSIGDMLGYYQWELGWVW